MVEYKKPVIILRKKIFGENSIEEIAFRIKAFVDVEIIILPYSSTSLAGILRNIVYVRQILAPVYHILHPSEAYLLPFLSHGRRIITYHDLGTRYSGRNHFYKWARILTGITPSKYFADYITFVSKQTLNEYKKKISRVNSSKLRLIYNSYDKRLVPCSSKDHDKFTVLQIGTSDRKNIDGTIEAVKGLDIKLDIIGKLKKEQIQKMEEYNIDYINRFDIPFEGIVNAYINCDIVCFPTFYEGFGVPVLEANVMERPVISSDIDIIHEIGQSAVYYINPHSIQCIRKAIIELMENEELRKQLIEAGKINAQRFEPEKIYKQYEKLYSKNL